MPTKKHSYRMVEAKRRKREEGVETMKFKNKPREIEAYQITKEMLVPILIDGEPYPKGLSPGGASYHGVDRTVVCWRGYVTTIHGQETKVTIGDWIITEPDGEHFYPCKPNIFEATYEPV